MEFIHVRVTLKLPADDLKMTSQTSTLQKFCKTTLDESLSVPILEITEGYQKEIFRIKY